MAVSALVVALVKYGLLALLWVFVLSAVRVVRADLFGGARTRSRPTTRPAATPGKRRSQVRRLVVTEGALTGTTLELGDAPLTLGRADDSTLVLSDDYASSAHARLVPGPDGGWLVEDMGSTNGTYLAGTRLVQATPVAPGAQIRIGKTVLELRR